LNQVFREDKARRLKNPKTKTLNNREEKRKRGKKNSEEVPALVFALRRGSRENGHRQRRNEGKRRKAINQPKNKGRGKALYSVEVGEKGHPLY